MGWFDWLKKRNTKSWKVTTNSNSIYTITREGEEWFLFRSNGKTMKKYSIISFGNIFFKNLKNPQDIIGNKIRWDNDRKIGNTNIVIDIKKL